MAESLLERIEREFPEAEDLAFRRIFARGHTIFFDTDKRTLLPGFTPQLVFAALLLAKTYVAQAGAVLELTALEKPLFRGYLVPGEKNRS